MNLDGVVAYEGGHASKPSADRAMGLRSAYADQLINLTLARESEADPEVLNYAGPR
jgi:hypothetical protein